MESSTVSLFSGLAVKDVLERTILPAFIAERGHLVEATFEPTKVLVELISDGARSDVILGEGSALQQLADERVLEPASLTPLVRSGVGVAVHLDATPPRIETIEQLVKAILRARAVAYSRTGASGAHFAQLLDKLGIASEVNEKACILEKGFTAEALLDGRADLAVQQVIELAAVDGVQIVGPLPAAAQHYVELWVGASPNPSTAAQSLLQFLHSGLAVAAYEKAGLEVCGS